tara:strand:+ start:3285 stop:3824 length:540 start_codon:yes stop_codon:yes gene_type:complete
MENRQHIDSALFREELETTLDRLAILFSESQDKFAKQFRATPKEVKKEMVRISQGGYTNTEHEDLADYAKEVLFYYESYQKKGGKKKKPKVKAFTLRNADDLNNFHDFLVSMVNMLEAAPKKFLREFPKCNPIYWDKIDDLREASYTYEYGSDMYVSCLQKCKHLSYSYSTMMEITEED